MFILIYKIIIPKITINLNCTVCANFLYIVIAYLGFYLFLLLISNIFLMPNPYIDYYIVYYIVIEFFLVTLL